MMKRAGWGVSDALSQEPRSDKQRFGNRGTSKEAICSEEAYV